MNSVFRKTTPVSSRRDGGGFTATELLVVMAVFILLIALVLPLFAKTREQGNQVKCLNNLKQIYTAFGSFLADHSGLLPRAGDWKLPTARYLYDLDGMTTIEANRRLQQRDSVYRCPSIPPSTINLTGANTQYIHGVGWNYYYIEPRLDKSTNGASPDNMDFRRPISSVNRQSMTIMLGDTYDTTTAEKWYYSHYLYPPGISVGPGNRHAGGINVICYDGHGEYLKQEFYQRPEEMYRWMYDPPENALP